ncbi:hypothetical protein BH09ACT6_BH09ACT6_23030 [soil metagenome]
MPADRPTDATNALYDEVLRIISRACAALFAQLEPALRHTPGSFAARFIETDSKV